MKIDVSMHFLQKGQFINTMTAEALDFIAFKCYCDFIKSNRAYQFSDAIAFIKTELSKEVLIAYSTFEKYQQGFYKIIAKTISKKKFIESEINAVKKFLIQAFEGIPFSERILDEINGLILINNEKEQVLQYYYKKYFLKNDYKTFIRIVYTYEFIKYLCFLEGEPLSEQPTNEQPKGKDYSALYNELIKKYFSDISKDEFNEVLNYKRLPNGKEKIKWIKDNGADAFRFKEFINFTNKEMNDCFSFPFGKLEGHDKPKHNGTKTDLSRILKRLQPQK